MWERIFVILRKEFIQALREPRMRVLLFVPPMVQLIVFGFAVNLDVDHARIAWMDMDRTPESRSLRDRFTGIGPVRHCVGAGQRRGRAARAGSRRGTGGGAHSAGLRAGHGARARHGSAGTDRRHELEYGVAGFELRGVDYRGVFGGRHGAAAEDQGADAQSRGRR